MIEMYKCIICQSCNVIIVHVCNNNFSFCKTCCEDLHGVFGKVLFKNNLSKINV